MRSSFGLLTGAAVLFAGLATGAPPPPVSSSPALPALDPVRLSQAANLSHANRYVEAAAIYEEQLKLQPENPVLLERLATMLHLQAAAEPDPAQAKALNKRARALAEQAQKFGATDPLTPLLLTSVRPDGSLLETAKGTYSSRADVEQLIRDGEAAFARHEYPKAIECYEKAFELEPTNSTAALFVGDAYFSSRQLEPACEWFRKAIKLSPDGQTAHRYLGDALDKLGSREEAFNEWITALICAPYERVTRQHFTPQMRAAAESRGHPIPRFPAMRSTTKDKQINLSVNPDDGALIMAYNICAMGWREKEFAGHFPKEKTPRRSLPEEIAAIEAMLGVAGHSKESDELNLKKWQPVIDGLNTLKSEGLLEAYVFFERADEGLAKDYAAYRAEHRDQLRRYLWIYWCGFE